MTSKHRNSDSDHLRVLIVTFPCPNDGREIEFSWPIFGKISPTEVDAQEFSLYCGCGWKGRLLGNRRIGLRRADESS